MKKEPVIKQQILAVENSGMTEAAADNPASDNANIDADAYQHEESRSSRPVIEREITLHSEQAQRVFRRFFSQLDNSAFSISVISRAHGNRLQAEQAEKCIKTEFARLRKELCLNLQQVEKICQDAEIADQGRMSNPLLTRARVSTNISIEFLNMLADVDDYLCTFEMLVILGEIDYDQRQQVTFEWQNRMSDVCVFLKDQAERLRHLCRKTAASR